MLIYRWILSLRHRAYDRGSKKSFKSAVPSICVGNVTVGGTGKTPFTEMLLRLLQDREGVAVLSRGYGRRTKGFLQVDPKGSAADFGDEPLQMARKFPERIVAVDKDRVAGCLKLKEMGSRCIILDDAFQYRRLKADLNIVLVNYSRPVFDDSLLPFGRLRDLPGRIFAADIIVVSKCPEDITVQEKSAFAERLHLKGYDIGDCTAVCPDGRKLKLLFSYISYMEPVMVFPEGDHRYVYSKQIVMMSGIAEDARLEAHLRTSYKVQRKFAFADHHTFSRSELAKVENELRHSGAYAVATTEKDAQRLLSLPYVSDYLKSCLFYVPIETVLTSSAEREVLAEELLVRIGE